ncbi:hypothetical protein EYF80_056054 [Liparis tanakae]|uniref:Uncharacterized protein n=1 Tax=Liparis tanakae TaxID=230148 RepID=A0A4Z2EXW6_9TELE|nr:hypothetical protein EYF80_056054 [Liparis tanakae]
MNGGTDSPSQSEVPPAAAAAASVSVTPRALQASQEPERDEATEALRGRSLSNQSPGPHRGPRKRIWTEEEDLGRRRGSGPAKRIWTEEEDLDPAPADGEVPEIL